MAILGVVLIHSTQYENFIAPEIIKNITSFGARGVQLFFLVSAFTLFLSFKNRANKEQHPTRNFFIRRFFRIAPMYYMVGIGYYGIADVSIWNTIAHVLFLHGFNPNWISTLVPGGWSVAVEVMFYAILPFLFSRIKNISQAINLFIVSIIMNKLLDVFFSSILHTDFGDTSFSFLYFPNQLPIFVLGIILYFIMIEKQNPFEISGKTLLIFSLCILGEFIKNGVLFSPIIVISMGFLILALGLSKYKFLLLVNPVITHLGKISFSMYLIHFAVLSKLSSVVFLNSEGILVFGMRFFIVTLITAIISTLTYYIIEIPFQNLGRKIIKATN